MDGWRAVGVWFQGIHPVALTLSTIHDRCTLLGVVRHALAIGRCVFAKTVLRYDESPIVSDISVDEESIRANLAFLGELHNLDRR